MNKNKKETIRQLENIQMLMECDIFHANEDINWCDNDDMYDGITKAIELLKGGSNDK